MSLQAEIYCSSDSGASNSSSWQNSFATETKDITAGLALDSRFSRSPGDEDLSHDFWTIRLVK
jgi:hypothetical protein